MIPSCFAFVLLTYPILHQLTMTFNMFTYTWIDKLTWYVLRYLINNEISIHMQTKTRNTCTFEWKKREFTPFWKIMYTFFMLTHLKLNDTRILNVPMFRLCMVVLNNILSSNILTPLNICESRFQLYHLFAELIFHT